MSKSQFIISNKGTSWSW